MNTVALFALMNMVLEQVSLSASSNRVEGDVHTLIEDFPTSPCEVKNNRPNILW